MAEFKVTKQIEENVTEVIDDFLIDQGIKMQEIEDIVALLVTIEDNQKVFNYPQASEIIAEVETDIKNFASNLFGSVRRYSYQSLEVEDGLTSSLKNIESKVLDAVKKASADLANGEELKSFIKSKRVKISKYGGLTDKFEAEDTPAKLL